ncbi:trypsin-like serine protease [Pseudoalteromonas luteoviolacea]|uniref:Peptidase S1 domain-containing protein n=1 Tax=Pseudoalteromonas luteoviolacea S4054 TaxID=1129367 RepID=A0A0F6AG88_9GAMM|nr:trypsin-like serine protease [Pseudoalteromonas luteoviolacea]AOT09962.1 trypsin [Pseudoalteromonas luteoviolacea]AOT14873.1 trypsin [Pseudoalteromonas luteoviolacea]AOT19789.1 trypsin [Pseudoalteromonas luteoviolacea]KKE85183.1 hypothetical protein N479_05480 [Pseudoalteromonas luteoviolacea S4054]KZN63953.1 hypothetical protein N481_02725 [Pseudoalteromonas luteoviolacea S4047-1]
MKGTTHSFKNAMRHTLLAVGIVASLPAFAFDDIQPNIVGGMPADTAEWPFYTQILRSNGTTAFCGGSYIGDGYVLTAAHCVRNRTASELNVKVAGFILGGSDGDRIAVEQVHMHPNYNNSTLHNDIAVLKLTRVPTQGASVTLAQSSIDYYAREGDLLTVAGLGRLQEGGTRPTNLYEVNVPLVSDAVCRQTGGHYSNVGATEFCAGYPQGQKDSCNGDSGGPIVIQSGGQTVQLGIVSWGVGCARPDNYGVYADVSVYDQWIESIKNGTVPVQVGYQEQTTLADFVVGDTVRHTFTITNTGSPTFTFNQLNVAALGVTSNLVTTVDTCSASTLTQNQNCKVSVEFSAATPGLAQTTLTFKVDGSTTTYVARVFATATDGSNVCNGTWDANTVYVRPDRVTYRGSEYEARYWTRGDIPSESGLYGAWKLIGNDPTCVK